MLNIAWRTLKDFVTQKPFRIALLDFGNGAFAGLHGAIDSNGAQIDPATGQTMALIKGDLDALLGQAPAGGGVDLTTAQTIGGAKTFAAAAAFSAGATMGGALGFGATTGTAGTTNRIGLFGSSYGFGISGGSLDYVAAGTHTYYIGSALIAQIAGTGMTLTGKLGASGDGTFGGNLSIGGWLTNALLISPSTYSSTPGVVNKVALFGTYFGLGVSSGSLDYTTNASGFHTFYVGGGDVGGGAVAAQLGAKLATFGGSISASASGSIAPANGWGGGWLVSGGATSTSAGIGIGFNPTNGTGYIQSQAPGVGWQAISVFASTIQLLAAGSSGISLSIDATGATTIKSLASLSANLDTAFGTTRGSILVRGAAGWALAAPSVSGQVPTFNGTDTTFQAPAALALAARAAVRQTVQAGPASAGAPSFLPATSSSLTLAAQNVAAATPLVVSAAQGFAASGQADSVAVLTAGPSWTLAANATSYLFVNAATGAASASTLPPVYAFGGTPATTAGQFTFDYQAMVGWLGNGSAAVATPLVCVGEAVAAAASVTSTIAYAYNGYSESGWTQGLPGTSQTVTRTHNIGLTPNLVRLVLECTTADNGYAVGDRVVSGFCGYNSSSGFIPTPIWATRLISGFATSNNATALGVPSPKGNVNGNGTTAASWKYMLISGRGW